MLIYKIICYIYSNCLSFSENKFLKKKIKANELEINGFSKINSINLDILSYKRIKSINFNKYHKRIIYSQANIEDLMIHLFNNNSH